ncbi:MAG: hypothetical protein ACXWF8_06805 [Methylobacter sp.]
MTSQLSNAKSIDDILPLYRLSAELCLALLDDPAIAEASDRRTIRALELVSEATQALYAACINLELKTKPQEYTRSKC